MGEIHDGGTWIGEVNADGVPGLGERDADQVICCELGAERGLRGGGILRLGEWLMLGMRASWSRLVETASPCRIKPSPRYARSLGGYSP